MSFLTGNLMDLLGAGLGAAAGGLANTDAARTGYSSNSSTQSGAGSSRRWLLPQQQDLLSPLMDRIKALTTDPSAGLEPIRQGLKTNVNENYSGMEDTLSSKLLSHGAASGKFGTAVRTADLARRSQLSGVDAQMAQMGLQQQNFGTSAAEQMLGMNFGTDTSNSMSSSQNGQYTVPGSVGGGAFLGGLDTLMTLLQLQAKLKGTSGGGPSLI